MRASLLRGSRLVAALLALAVCGGCDSETLSDESEPSSESEQDGTRLTLVRILEHGNDAGALAFSPDGQTLATGGGMIAGEGTIKLWSMST